MSQLSRANPWVLGVLPTGQPRDSQYFRFWLVPKIEESGMLPTVEMIVALQVPPQSRRRQKLKRRSGANEKGSGREGSDVVDRHEKLRLSLRIQ